MLVETVSDAHVHFHYSARRFRDVLLANILAGQNKNEVPITRRNYFVSRAPRATRDDQRGARVVTDRSISTVRRLLLTANHTFYLSSCNRYSKKIRYPVYIVAVHESLGTALTIFDCYLHFHIYFIVDHSRSQLLLTKNKAWHLPFKYTSTIRQVLSFVFTVGIVIC